MKTISMIFLLLQMNLFSQDPPHRWKLGFNFSPESTHRYITGKNGGFSQWPFQGNSLKKHRFGYTLGIAVACSLNNNIGLETGINYALKGFGSENIQGSPNTIKGPYFVSYNMEMNFRYMELPLKITFTAGSRPLHFITSFSVMAGYLLEARNMINTELKNGTNQSEGLITTKDYVRFNLTPCISAGIEYSLQGIQFRLEPLFRFGALNIQSTSVNGFSTYLWSAGVNVSCYFTL